jgi:superfamily II DNA or RNA helicase
MIPAFRTSRDLLARGFAAGERLLLHQLRLLEWLANQLPPEPEAGATADLGLPKLTDLSDPWILTPGIELSEWQQRCREAWFANGRKGTVKVVTGAGKTILALAIVEALHNQHISELRVAVVVPTVVLMNQWYDQVMHQSNLPVAAIGRLGGGFQDSFSDQCRFLIAVLDTAQSKLPEAVARQGLGDRLLMIADECHRAGAPLMSRVLKTPRIASLGLSATPEREDSEEESAADFAESLLGRELGHVVFELTLAQALEMGIIPPYTIKHYGVDLTPAERATYERLSRSISDCRADLQNQAPPKATRGGRFFAWIQRVAKGGSHDVSAAAIRFLGETSERKELLYGAEARYHAVARILSEEFRSNPEAMAILFHESIDSVNELFLRLQAERYPVVLEHSKLPQELRSASLDLFRKGVARVVVSAKSLIEGFNVPAVDVGIIVASSTSVRQRIQSMGRVLRRHKTAGGEEKNPSIHILYVRNTVDELIYEREDWGKLTGAERNLYYTWDPTEEPELQLGPPRACLPPDYEVDVSGLKPGDLYPGRLEGEMYSCDSQGNIRDQQDRHIANPKAIYEAVREVLGRPGRFYVTPQRHYCLVRVPGGDDWETRFVTALPAPLVFADPQGAPKSTVDRAEWLKEASPGDPYPFEPEAPTEKLKFSQKQGGVIARKIPRGEVFALVGTEARNEQRGRDASNLLQGLKSLQMRGERISHFEIDSRLDAVYRKDGRLWFIASLKEGLEFPE